MFKNTASQKIAVFAFDTTTGTPKTSDAANITVYVNKDWAGVVALTDTSATELDSTNAKGWYLFDVSQTETNADALHFTGKSATANISVVGQLIFTTPANFSALGISAGGHVSNVDTLTTYTGNTVQTGDAYARLGAPAGVSVSADVAAVSAKTTNLPASPAATGDIPTANANADALLDRAAGVETNRTPRQALRLMLAALAGKLSGAATATVTIRDTNDGVNRIVATVDADGNRSAVTLDAS